MWIVAQQHWSASLGLRMGKVVQTENGNPRVANSEVAEVTTEAKECFVFKDKPESQDQIQ